MKQLKSIGRYGIIIFVALSLLMATTAINGCGGIQVTVINTTSHDNTSSDTNGSPRDVDLHTDSNVTKHIEKEHGNE